MRTIKIAAVSDEGRLYFFTRHVAPVLAHSYDRVSLSLSLFRSLFPFPLPFSFLRSLRHRYVLCDPIAPSCPTAAQVRDTNATRARAIEARITRATLAVS